MKARRKELWIVTGGECLDCGLRNALTVLGQPKRHKHYGFRLSSKCQGCGGSGKSSTMVTDLPGLIRDMSRRRQRPLTAKQRLVLELRYGLKDGNSYTFQEIGELMGISKQMVHRHEEAAVKKIENVVSRGDKVKVMV